MKTKKYRVICPYQPTAYFNSLAAAEKFWRRGMRQACLKDLPGKSGASAICQWDGETYHYLKVGRLIKP